MDNFDEIALSRIATIINKKRIVRTHNNATWNRILSNAGQSGLYEAYSSLLNPYSYNGSYQNENHKFDEFYTAIKNILKAVYSNGENTDKFVILISSIVDEMDLMDLFDGDINELMPRRSRGYFDSLDDYFKDVSDEDGLKFIKENAVTDFREFLQNLHILNQDIIFTKGKLQLKPFTEQSNTRNPSLLVDWLNDYYPEIGRAYKEAVENYINGQAVPCLSSCRNVITGIFSEFKNDGNKWVKGLQNLSTDRNIENVVTPNNIVQGSANKNIVFDDQTKQFNYPRFTLFYDLYSFTSDLGAHNTEAPKINGVLYPETTTLNDALLGLRMTEDVLIWVKERLKTYSN
ncbi:hypothetical protein PAESOLCIP111_01310 [Paenibacillus solanacearum]|uniref:Uncharacterized protein n=1 Tax=Paenibacillus solanacearum TaxID=2048548 RepID=A0A916JXU9_9BACL|nr:hypothetical protein [Paenibacillus solanacearum]CAG7610940.1 hypothetical protein PAESOLCIP111_01310 [Paenibacillus solanacearum]